MLIIIAVASSVIAGCGPGMPKGDNPKFKNALPKETTESTPTTGTDTGTEQPAGDTGTGTSTDTSGSGGTGTETPGGTGSTSGGN